MTKLTVGMSAPDFDLPTDGSGSLRLSDLRGKKVVLYFYPKDDTSGCTKESIEFNELKDEFEKTDTLVIGLSPDSPASHAKFKAKHGLALTLVADETKHMLETYGVWVQKSMYGRKYMGVERTTLLIGNDGRIARIWRKVKVAGHAAEVLEGASLL